MFASRVLGAAHECHTLHHSNMLEGLDDSAGKQIPGHEKGFRVDDDICRDSTSQTYRVYSHTE